MVSCVAGPWPRPTVACPPKRAARPRGASLPPRPRPPSGCLPATAAAPAAAAAQPLASSAPATPALPAWHAWPVIARSDSAVCKPLMHANPMQAGRMAARCRAAAAGKTARTRVAMPPSDHAPDDRASSRAKSQPSCSLGGATVAAGCAAVCWGCVAACCTRWRLLWGGAPAANASPMAEAAVQDDETPATCACTCLGAPLTSRFHTLEGMAPAAVPGARAPERQPRTHQSVEPDVHESDVFKIFEC